MEPYDIKLDSQKYQSSQQQRLGQIDSNIDQPALQTLLRDLKGIGIKMRYVLLLLPKLKQEASNELKHWDLWGPLIIGLFFSISLALASTSNGIQNFINIFVIYWIGAFIVAVNSKLLRSRASIFQTICAVGYCLLPLSLFGLLVSSLHAVMPLWLKLIFIILGLLWSIFACIIVNSQFIDSQKKFLSGYPIVLFYIFLAWYSIVV